MVRHTHRRRNSRRRRQTRGRRTQKGGFSFSGLFGSSDVNALQQELREERDPVKRGKIVKEIKTEQENKRHDEELKKIDKGDATESNMGNQYGNLGSGQYGNQEYGNQEYGNKQYGNQEYRQFGDNNNNALNEWQRGGSRRRHRRHRRK